MFTAASFTNDTVRRQLLDALWNYASNNCSTFPFSALYNVESGVYVNSTASPALGGLFASIRLAWNEQRYHHSVLHGRELVFQWRHFAPHQFRSHSWRRSWRCCRFACARRARSLAASMSPISREIDLPEPVPFKPSIPYSLIVPPEKRRRGSHGGVPPLPSMDSSVAVRTAPLPNHATAPPTTSDPLGSRLDELLNLRSDIQDLRRIVLGAHVAGPEPSDLGAPPSYS